MGRRTLFYVIDKAWNTSLKYEMWLPGTPTPVLSVPSYAAMDLKQPPVLPPAELVLPPPPHLLPSSPVGGPPGGLSIGGPPIGPPPPASGSGVTNAHQLYEMRLTEIFTSALKSADGSVAPAMGERGGGSSRSAGGGGGVSGSGSASMEYETFGLASRLRGII